MVTTPRPDGVLGDITVLRTAAGELRILRVRYGSLPTDPAPDPGVPTVAATVRSVSSAQLDSGTATRTVTRPADTTAGDLLVAVVSVDAGATTALALPSGFTEASRVPTTGTDLRMLVGYKRATAGEPDAYTFTVPSAADARVDVMAVRHAHPTLAPVVVTATSASSLTTHTTPTAFPPASRNLVIWAAAKDEDTAAQTWSWTAPAGASELTDAHSNGWVTQAVFTATWDSPEPVGVRTATVTQVGTGLASPAVAATIVVPSAETAPVATTYTPIPTGGSGGAPTDELGITFTAATKTSRYHRWAAHLDPSTPAPLVVHLHGDGAYEYDNPHTWTTPAYVAAARAAGALVIVPNTPDVAGSRTWWEDWSSTEWLVALIRRQYTDYNLDRRRVFLSGFSGGAVVTTSNLLADFAGEFTGGGAMLLGGGGPYETAATTPTAATKADFLLRWHVGELDDGRNTDDNYDARADAEAGEALYAAAGWDTSLTYLPGLDHLGSEPYGPDALAALIAESNAHYGL